MRRQISIIFLKKVLPMRTSELARGVDVTPEHIRKVYQKTGNYLGLVPVRLPNNRLLWPNDAIALLKKGGAK